MKEQIEAAAGWWADQLREGAKQDNGEPIQSMLATMLAATLPPVPPEAVDEFERALIAILEERLVKTVNPDDPAFGSYLRCVGCDYHPDHILSAAAETAGLPVGCPPFPMKTRMLIDPDRVCVACGYGAADVQIWPCEGVQPAEPKETVDDDPVDRMR